MSRCRHKLCRSRRTLILSDSTKKVSLFAYEQLSERWREWKYRTVSMERVNRLLAKGEVEPVTRETGRGVEVVGYRCLFPTKQRRPTPTTLTMATMHAVANAVGNQAELQLTWSEEKQVAKFLLWPFEFDRKNPSTVGPRVTAVEQGRARHALKAAA
jgi:hypothetical protein